MKSAKTNESKSAKYQRAFRERLKQQGFVQRSIYISPKYAGLVSRIEKALQTPGAHMLFQHLGDTETMTNQTNNTIWNTLSLFDALKMTDLIESNRANIELIDGIEPAINLVLLDRGDLPIQIAVSGEQIFMSSPLWEDSQVKDKGAFNELALLTNPINPLSNIGLLRLEKGKKLYIMFGELSSRSMLSHILEEVDTLAANTLQAAEDFAEHLMN